MAELRIRHIRSRRAVLGALGVVVAGLLATFTVTARGETFAAFSDLDLVAGNQTAAGTWNGIPDIPQQCIDHGILPVNIFLVTSEGTFYSDGTSALVLVGPNKPGSTTNGQVDGTPQNDLIVNDDTTRTIHGWEGDDCLVAGRHDDILHGDGGTDVMIGGKQQHKGEHLYPGVS